MMSCSPEHQSLKMDFERDAPRLQLTSAAASLDHRELVLPRLSSELVYGEPFGPGDPLDKLAIRIDFELQGIARAIHIKKTCDAYPSRLLAPERRLDPPVIRHNCLAALPLRYLRGATPFTDIGLTDQVE